ncbi:ornithine decarboxylase-like [Amphiura filiformis]|uniref:ornithine decarboxylase-like n=1 Tax=Amphiura filiformis TaxID=82378 RepID=UPI003B20DFC4
MAQFIEKDFQPYMYTNGDNKRKFIMERTQELCGRKFVDDAFMVVDIGDVLKKHKEWLSELPRITPFYAVKCMPYDPLLSVLASLGCGFDCASLGEINRVLRLGVSPSRIVLSHTQKQRSHLSYASKCNVDLMTFDDTTELLKIKEVCPEARLLLRLSVFDKTAHIIFGHKFGCLHNNVHTLLEFAKKHRLNVTGIHFHIGSGSQDPDIFERALKCARDVFDIGMRLGFSMTILDIGGGFPARHTFKLFAGSVRKGIDSYFPPDSGVTIIAEPGRFYVQSAATLVANIIGIKSGRRLDTNTETYNDSTEMSDILKTDVPLNYDYMYFVNDGLFTSFLANVFEFPITLPKTYKEVNVDEMEYESVVVGQTVAEQDVIVKDCMLPQLKVGDWIVFEDMGAYTTCLSTEFNGFDRPFFFYAVPENVWSYIHPLLVQCREQMTDTKAASNQTPNTGKHIVDISTTEILQSVYSLQAF